MKLDGITPEPRKNLAEESSNKVAEEMKLKEACQEFESMLLNQIFTQMRKSTPKSSLFGESQNNEFMASMLDEERAKQWSKTDGVGIANILYQQMKDTV